MKDIIPENIISDEAKKEMDKIAKIEKTVDREKLIYKSSEYKIFEGRGKVLNAFDNKIFTIKTKGSGYLESKPFNFKILTPKQILQRLPIALAHIKAGNNSQSLLNEIRQIVDSLYQSKEITKKVYNNILKSIKV